MRSVEEIADGLNQAVKAIALLDSMVCGREQHTKWSQAQISAGYNSIAIAKEALIGWPEPEPKKEAWIPWTFETFPKGTVWLKCPTYENGIGVGFPMSHSVVIIRPEPRVVDSSLNYQPSYVTLFNEWKASMDGCQTWQPAGQKGC